MLNDFKLLERKKALDELINLNELLTSLNINHIEDWEMKDIKERTFKNYSEVPSHKWVEGWVEKNRLYGSIQYLSEREIVPKAMAMYELMIKSELFEIVEDLIQRINNLQNKFINFIKSIEFIDNTFGFALRSRSLSTNFLLIFDNFLNNVYWDGKLNRYVNVTTLNRRLYPDSINSPDRHDSVNSDLYEFSKTNSLMLVLLNLRCETSALSFVDSIWGNLTSDLREFNDGKPVLRSIDWPYTLASGCRAIIRYNNQQIPYDHLKEPRVTDNPAKGILNYASLVDIISKQIRPSVANLHELYFKNGEMVTSVVQALGVILSSKGISKNFIGKGNLDLTIKYLD